MCVNNVKTIFRVGKKANERRTIQIDRILHKLRVY